MEALATQPTARGKLIPDAVDGHRVGWFPASNLLYAEGHPAEEGLAPAEALVPRLRALEGAIRDLGVPVESQGFRDPWDWERMRPTGERSPGCAGVRRLDVTVDLVADADHGAAVMAGIAALTPARHDVVVRRGRRGRIETVAWMGARGLLARCYDKGVESGMAPPGERNRLEAQYRWGAQSRRDPAELSPSYVRDKFVSRFVPLWRASKGVKVMGAVGFVNELREAVKRDELTVAQAEQVLAFQLLGSVDQSAYNERTRRRRAALVRETGYVLANGVMEEVEINLQDVLEEVMETPAWGGQG
jgi:hypothetical protein